MNTGIISSIRCKKCGLHLLEIEHDEDYPHCLSCGRYHDKEGRLLIRETPLIQRGRPAFSAGYEEG